MNCQQQHNLLEARTMVAAAVNLLQEEVTDNSMKIPDQVMCF